MGAPIIVLGRPHSGTRVLAGLLRASGVFVGADLTRPQLDSWSMHQDFVLPLLRGRLASRISEEAQDALARRCFDLAWSCYSGSTVVDGRWGWKCCETSFVMPVVRRLLPRSVFVHLVRDGRDVVLSGRGHFQITAPSSSPPGWRAFGYGDFSRLVTFGETGVRYWRGLDLDDVRDVLSNRFLLQMQAWMTAVTWARRDAVTLGGGYHEVRYEDLCADPVAVARDLLRRLGLPWSASAAAFVERHISAVHVGRWRRARLTRRETRDFSRAVALARPLLQECGYAV